VIGLVQRVSQARVEVEGEVVGQIGPGLLLLACAEATDGSAQLQQMIDKVLKLRIFSDARGKMHHALADLDGAGTTGGLLIVSQFTLAAEADQGRALYDELLAIARQRHPQVASGVFGAHMALHLVNDGPVTIPLTVR
jgi:D-aminoacyl-tRNA deacylase